MGSLVFRQLTILSDTQKSANQFEFSPRLNLITGNDNSVGKSTLAKLLFWTLGCDPEFDVFWKALDVKAVVDFSVSGKAYQAGRHGNIMFFRARGEAWEVYSKITGKFSENFCRLVNFQILLPNRNDSTVLESPPPAFYFLPFYIDQRKSWSHAWASFVGLEQYARWQNPVIKYHTGYLTPSHFEIDEEIAEH
jgi:hypothetical protein